MNDVTQLIERLKSGDAQAAEELLPRVYDELRRLARAKLQHERPGMTLQATALVHEAYLRLVDVEAQAQWQSRGHFFAAAAEAMRRILVENARRRLRIKHGGDREQEPLADDAIAAPEIDGDLIELDAALNRLAEQHPRKAELVKLRYFAGLTQEQAAEALQISIATAERDWSYARAWLYREVNQGEREKS